jgi:penicillin-binding protein 2
MPNPYLDPIFTEWYKTRLIGAMVAVLAAFCVIGLRLFMLQVVEGAEYRRLSVNNCIRLQTIDAPRGVIYDRNGALLVDNRPAFHLQIVLKDARPVSETLARLSRYTGISVSRFESAIEAQRGTPDYRPLTLMRDIGRDLLAVVEAYRFDLPGIVVDVQPLRHYLTDVAPHLIGYLSEIRPDELAGDQFPGARGGDFVGRYGVERSAESILRGKNGGRQVEVDARGQVVRVLERVAPIPGRNVRLTLDLALQRRAEALMAGKVGAVVAIDPANGEVLAMASNPGFDPNAFVQGMSHAEWRALISNPDRPMENKVVQAEYPPASTYKVVTAMAALEAGVIDLKTEFFCPGHLVFGDRTFRCWRRGGHGHVAVVDALAVSCDVFFYHVGHRLGVDRLAEFAAGCGLGRPTGIDLDNEGAGLIPTAAWKRRRTGVPWQQGETLSIAIGQGYNLTTPLQMAVLTAALANGGVLYRPQVIRRVETVSGEVEDAAQPEIAGSLPASPETLEILRTGLDQVVNGPRGTARRVAMPDVRISGKTGTAQVISKRLEEIHEDDLIDRHKPHAWFIAVGERGESQLAVAVLVEHGEHGSGTAAPIAGEVIRTHFLGGDPEIALRRSNNE